MSSVKLTTLRKAYGENEIVPGLTLEVHEGELVSLLGPSGCGKTTVLRMVAGLEEPTDGVIAIGDSVVFDRSQRVFVPPEKRQMGMVFQSYAIWPHLSVFNNVAFPLRCQHLPKDQIEIRVMSALKNVRLEKYRDRKPNQLSGGQQQRVALARALVANPKVVLLDEPLSNLDANLRDEMCEEIIRLRKEYRATMLFVTHDQAEAFRLSDRIALLNQGRLEQFDSPANVRRAPQSDFVKKFLRL